MVLECHPAGPHFEIARRWWLTALLRPRSRWAVWRKQPDLPLLCGQCASVQWWHYRDNLGLFVWQWIIFSKLYENVLANLSVSISCWPKQHFCIISTNIISRNFFKNHILTFGISEERGFLWQIQHYFAHLEEIMAYRSLPLKDDTFWCARQSEPGGIRSPNLNQL